MSSQRGSDNVLAPGTAESGTLVSRADTQRTVGGTEAKGILLWLILFVFLTLKTLRRICVCGADEHTRD